MWLPSGAEEEVESACQALGDAVLTVRCQASQELEEEERDDHAECDLEDGNGHEARSSAFRWGALGSGNMSRPLPGPSAGPPRPQRGATNVRLRVWVPLDWHGELKSAAAAQGISTADLLRILIRGFLRGRYES